MHALAHYVRRVGARATVFLALGAAVAFGSAAAVSLVAPGAHAPVLANTPPSPGVSYPVKLQGLAGNPKHLAVDNVGNLWFAAVQPSAENRLYRYEPNADALASWPLPSRPGGGWFVGLAIGQGGKIWVAWDQTIASIDTPTGASEVFDVPTETAYLVQGTDGKWVRDLAITGDGHLWLTRHHAASLLEFDPRARAFTEHALGPFGVGDRIRIDGDQVWVTQARDAATAMEFTQVAVFDRRAGTLGRIPERASDIAIAATGQAFLAGNAKGMVAIDSSRQVTGSVALPFPWSASDVIAALGGGGFALGNRTTSTVAAFQPASTGWALFKLRTTAQPIQAPAGYRGPSLAEVPAEVTSIVADSHGVLWVAIPNYDAIARIQL